MGYNLANVGIPLTDAPPPKQPCPPHAAAPSLALFARGRRGVVLLGPGPLGSATIGFNLIDAELAVVFHDRRQYSLQHVVIIISFKTV